MISSFGQRLGIEADLPIYNSPADSKTRTFKSDLSEYEETESSQKRLTIHNGCTCVNYILPTLLTSRYGHYGTNNPRLPLDTDGGAHQRVDAAAIYIGGTRSSRQPVAPANASSSLRAKSAAAGAAIASNCCDCCCAIERAALPRPYAPRPAVAGSADGGGYSVSPSSKRWPALRRATCGSIRNSPLAGPPLPDILDLAPSAGPSRLPLRCSFTPTARMEKGAGEKKNIIGT